ncbi:MAG: YicC family protein [Candidatus Eisenbacteria bacterium]|uniref:YicC family protein n=1 Tax=Eiseniibacteriota bacterium TaxID=2212470 RepID=A0A956RQF7_UNCEI|nr:YicC family protein [Candidatus Eisenbacteria bacterium]
MLLSMTGYGRGDAPFGTRRLQVEIRTVNHRFCEISLRLPRAIAGLENRMREYIQPRISRGKITVNVTIDGIEAPVTRLRLNDDVASSYFSILEELKQRFQLAGDLELGTFLSLPDVLTWESEDVTEDDAWAQLEPALVAAVADVGAMKAREGENLARDVRARLDAIMASLDRVVERVPGMLQDYRQRIADRLAELKTDPDFNQARLEIELVLFADRTDCTEECVRLRSHVDQFRGLIDSPEPAGRKLNFLLQEMNREANTIGSKASDVPIARDVIEIKEEIEKLREQVQNFE